MNNLCTEIDFRSLNKFGEELCGDHVDIVEQEDNSSIVVLADGLGSGVKANILSTLTAKIISTMMAQSMSIEDCVATIASTLPVCSVRGIAYSTFSIIRIIDSEEAEIIQYDNPHVILLRNGKNVEMPETSMEIGGKTIYRSRVPIRRNDVFIAMSDGAVHAGVGKLLNFGWKRDDIIHFMETLYDVRFTAKIMTGMLLEQCGKLYQNEPGDDTTVCTIRIRNREPINLVVGPPANPNDVRKMMSLFFSKEGKHIVCGGTTSSLAAKYLGKDIRAEFNYVDPSIPPTAEIEGVDLVTEGVLTINRVLTYAQNYLNNEGSYSQWRSKRDGASLLARILFEEATDINFYVGKAVNPAHQNPELPINFSIKMRLVDELSDCLRKMGKRIKVSYF
ncbi:MAG: hypothetical protein PWQ55_1809 [Chloroflexota bacterium]|nr:hypothetical protein [Chloroflexota bacterium]